MNLQRDRAKRGFEALPNGQYAVYPEDAAFERMNARDFMNTSIARFS